VATTPSGATGRGRRHSCDLPHRGLCSVRCELPGSLTMLAALRLRNRLHTGGAVQATTTMNIVVCVKHVPDATADRRFESDNTVDRVGVDGLLSELDEYAVEQAVQIKEKLGDDTTVTVLTVGPDNAVDAIRKALQMGAEKGVHVVDDAIAGSDAPGPPAVRS